MDWDKLYQTYYKDYPDDNFWDWVIQSYKPSGAASFTSGITQGLSTLDEVVANLPRFYQQYQSGQSQLGQPETYQWDGLSPLEAALSSQYMQALPATLQERANYILSSPDATEKEKGEAQWTLDNMSQIISDLQTALMRGGPAGYEMAQFESMYGSEVGDRIRVPLAEKLYASPAVQIGEASYRLVDGIFYDTRGNRMSPEAQETLTKNYESGQFATTEGARLSQERAAQLAQSKQAYISRGKEWEDVSNKPWLLSPDETTRRPWDPSVREREIPEAMWNNPNFKAAYQQALNELQPTELYPAFKGMAPPDTLQGKQALVHAQVNIPQSTQLHTEQLARNRAMEQVANPANLGMTARAAVQNAPQAVNRGGGWGPTRAELRAREAAKKKQAAEWNALVQKALQAANKPREFAIL